MLTLTTHSRNNLVVSKTIYLNLNKKITVYDFRFKEKRSTATNGKQTQPGEYPERDPSPTRMVRKRQTLHLIRVALASLSRWCGPPPWNARLKVDGALGTWVRHLPRTRRTFFPVLWRDHQTSNASWSRTRASPSAHPWRNQNDNSCLPDSLLI